MKPRHSPAMRLKSGAVLAVFLNGMVVAPLLHLREHEASSPRERARHVDPNDFRDSSGRVDLQRLATALGLDGHDESQPHSHGPFGSHSSNPLEHGAGAIEHHGLALLNAPVVMVLLTAVAPPPPPPAIPNAPEPLRPIVHLKAQRAQAPPVV